MDIELLEDYYDGEIPSYIVDNDYDFIVILISDYEGEKELRITMEDMIEYMTNEANSRSGVRTLSGHTGDWRPMNRLAQEVLGYFIEVNEEDMGELLKKNNISEEFIADFRSI